MRAYLAGIYQTGGSTPGARSIHQRVTERVRYPHVLESFHYSSERMAKAIRRNRQRIFLDSGAFSAFTQGAWISPREYARFIRQNHDLIELAANLDVIGRGHEQVSYSNLRIMQKLLEYDGLSHLIKPVHHLRDDDDWLRRYLGEGHDFICLGGLVPESAQNQRRWLDHVWARYLTKPDGTPKVKVHGFGLANRKLIFRYPWHSVYSTSWVHISRNGGVVLDFKFPDGSISDHVVIFSETSSSRTVAGSWHYSSLSPADRMQVDRRLRQLEAKRARHPELAAAFKATFGCRMGFNPTALGRCYGLRDLCNIAYFERLGKRGVDRFVRVRQ